MERIGRTFAHAEQKLSDEQLEAVEGVFRGAFKPETFEGAVQGQEDGPEHELADTLGAFLHRDDVTVVAIDDPANGKIMAATASLPMTEFDPNFVDQPDQRTGYLYVAARNKDNGSGLGFGRDVLRATVSELRARGYTHVAMHCTFDGMAQTVHNMYSGKPGALTEADYPNGRVYWTEVGPQTYDVLDLAAADDPLPLAA